MSWAPTSAGDLRACQGNIPHGVTSAGGTFDRVGVVSSVGPGLGGGGGGGFLLMGWHGVGRDGMGRSRVEWDGIGCCGWVHDLSSRVS